MFKIDFRRSFADLTGSEPFPWQEALYQEFACGVFPSSCDLPTGLGKTAVIPIWLIALAAHPETIPRRLVYVVNRRTVVDQATTETSKILDRIRMPETPTLETLKAELAKLCAEPTDIPLAISTLRGQFADNREWSADPARPAVICGTVDMIGSRLLFSGYGIGFKSKPLHAGFLGQDVLLVHDEAHLEPAFQHLLTAIQKEQELCNEFRPFRVMALSATSRGGEAFGLTDNDRSNPTIRKRIDAVKRIHLHENKDEKKPADEIATLALDFKDSGQAILVFVQKVEDVEIIVKKLPKSSTEQLTGTLRGLERDGLLKKPVLQRFLARSNRDPNIPPEKGTIYLVCTSAGEVGINISSDHLVCDLTTFESMAQRFGRVNRFGDSDDTEVHIVHPNVFEEKIKKYESARKKTLDLLRSLNGDGSPSGLATVDRDARISAFAPEPIELPVTDILFDVWALTTVRDKLPGRPPVEPYLHGISEWQPPETFVAWREEVKYIKGDLIDVYQPKDILDIYPLKPHEMLRDASSRVFDRLKKLKTAKETPIWIVDEDNTVEVSTLADLVGQGKERIENRTILLPPKAGGLDKGMLSADSPNADDVADQLFDGNGRPSRLRVWKDDEDFEKKTDGMRLIRRIDMPSSPDDEDAEDRSWFWFESPRAGDDDGSKSNLKPVRLGVHVNDVMDRVAKIVASLPLSDEMRKAIILAARFHDDGKGRGLFQRMLGNTNLDRLLAKSGKTGPRFSETFRHEFASLLDVETKNEFLELTDDAKDLVLHLIATHHGRGRPHFPQDEAFDPERTQAESDRIAIEVPRRFARLQRKYGRWGLAYLESLLRAADYAASAKPSSFAEDQ